jgi:hypothetical protein
MHPDEEPFLKPVFSELHRRRREQAPPFEVMRERAMAQDRDRRPSGPFLTVQRLAWASAVCIAAIAVCWIEQVPTSRLPRRAQVDASERVDELITAIEQQLDRDPALTVPDYPTDVLLAENHTDFSE